MRFRYVTLFFVALLLWIPVAALAQGVTGSISGIVKDPNGAVVPGARVVARNVGTNAETPALTDGSGYYRFSNLVSGSYSIEVEAKGFRKATTSPQRLSTGDRLRIDVSLELGQVTETVTIEETATQVNTEDAQMGKALRDIPQLPILSGAAGRNPLALAVTQTGVSSYNPTPNQPGSFSVNGQRVQGNNYLLDGGDSNDLAINVPDSVENISPNALAEFRIVTGAMKAEYGRAMGGVVEVTTKSGTNAWHGALSETFRNTKLNAAPFFAKSTTGGTKELNSSGFARNPQWNSNDFDAGIGGPIRKDKTFFNFTYLGFRRRQGERQSATVISDADRALVNQYGTPEAKNLIALVPRPNAPGGVLLSSPTNQYTRDQGTGKLDHYFSAANHFSATYFREDQVSFAPFAFGGSTVPGFGTTGTLRFQNAVLRDTHTFTPNLFNEFRASYHRRGTLSVIPVNKTSVKSLGLTGIIPDDPSADGPPFVDISGLSGFGNTYQGPQGRADNTFQYIDNLSWTRGRHYLKFGGEFRTYAQNQVFDFINSGYIYMDGSGVAEGIVDPIPGIANDALSDFARGFATEFDQANANRQGYRTRSFNGFVQDDWKIASNFTLNFGVRYEFNKGLVELRDRVATFRRGLQSTVFPDAPVGFVYPGDKDVSRSTYHEDYNNFAPRLGFAWDVFKNGKLAVRGGYGLFYDSPISELTLQFLGVPPYGIQPIILYTQYKDPYPTSLVNPTTQPFPFVPVPKGGHFDYTAIAPISQTVMDPNFRTPYGQMFNLSTQWQVHKDWLLDVGYVGSTGVKLLNRKELNPAIPGPGATVGNTNQRRILNQNNPQNAAYGGAVYGSITNQLTDANSNYNSLQVSVTKRFSRGFSMTNAYTWAHGIDNASGLRVNSRWDNPRADRGRSETDIRHRYVATFIYELPFFKGQHGAVGRVLGGWGISGVTTFQTGIPINITESQDRALNGAGAQRPDYIGGNIQILDPRRVDAVPGRPNSWFNGTGGGTGGALTNPYFRRVGTAASWAAGAGRYGNFGRNVLSGPGLNNWDLAAFKRIKIHESHEVEFRAEAFNAFNHTQFSPPQGSIGSSTFGRITNTRDPRLMQLALRYQF